MCHFSSPLMQHSYESKQKRSFLTDFTWNWKNTGSLSGHCGGCYCPPTFHPHSQAFTSHQTHWMKWSQAVPHNANPLPIKDVQWSSLPPRAINLQEEAASATVTNVNLFITAWAALWSALIRAYKDALTEGGTHVPGNTHIASRVSVYMCVCFREHMHQLTHPYV